MRTGADEELLAKTMWCSVISKAARAARSEPPSFVMIEGAKIMNYMEAGKVHGQPTGLQRTWPRYLEAMGIEVQYGSMVSNLDYEPTTMTTSTKTGRWTAEFKEETVKAINRWLWAPDFKQKARWMARMDAGSFLESLSDKELEQWRVHLRNNHIPYNRKCKTCVESSGTGRRHVRVKTPSSYCLSLDVCGPFRKKGVDPDHSDYRFALVGAYVIPKLYHEVRDGGPHRHEVRDGGPHKDEVRDGGPHKDEVRDGGPHKDEVRDGGPHKDEVRDGGPDQSEEGLSDSAVPIYGGDFEPEVSEDTGVGLGPLQEWQEGELFENGDVANPSTEEELRLPRGMSEEEFKEVFSQVGGVEGYQVIYVSSMLRSRTTKDVLAAVQDLYLRLRAHGCPILRIHSDRARELRSDPLRKWLASHGTYTTYTEGQSPQANGRAEAAVKYAKTQTKRLLTAGNFAPRLWPMALRYAMWAQMQKQLYPEKKLIPFGTRVHVRKKVYGTGGRYDLESRWGTGYYLGPSADVNEGSVIMMDKGNFITTAHMRPGLLNVDREVELEDYQALVSIPSRRLRRKSTLDPGDFEGVPQLPPPDDEEEGTKRLAYDPNDPVEEYARAVLKEDRIDRDLVESLARLLPTDGKKPSRFGDPSDDECIWASGAFVHGGVVGILNNTRKYPLATKVFVNYLKDQCPGFKCNSVAVFKGIKAKPHKDAHNVGVNAVVPLTDFEGCEVMVKRGEKTVALKVSEGPQFFDPHEEHYTTPCTKGTSLMLVGYSIRDSAKLKEEMVSFLVDLGFIWDPHRASEGKDQGAALRLAMMKKSQVHSEKGGGSVREERPRDGGLDHVNADLDVAIGDLEDRAARLRDLLEEEEIMVEQASRLGQALRSELGDTRDYVCKYLDDVHRQLMQFQCLRERAFLRSVKKQGNENHNIDYEKLLDELEGDLDIVHTVPLDQVRTLAKISYAEAKALEKKGWCQMPQKVSDGDMNEHGRSTASIGSGIIEVIRDSGDFGEELWMVQRPLYGLRESPMIWSEFRNSKLRQIKIVHNGRRLGLRQTVSESELWLLQDEETLELYGLLVVYVDDLMYMATQPLVEELHNQIRALWPTSSLEWIDAKKGVRYLGVEIKQDPGSKTFSISQQAYIAELLRAHNMQDTMHTQLPVPREWLEAVELDKNEEPSFTEEDLRTGQRYVGEALWLATKTRPDILYTVNAMASHVARKPLQITRMGERLLSYLAGTADLELKLVPPSPEERHRMVCFTDASFAPFGARSYGATVIVYGQAAVSWKAGKQSFITMSTMESELYAAAQGYVLLQSVSAILREIGVGPFDQELAIDNSSAVAMCTGGPGSQRTRHLKVRASCIREAVASGQLIVRHTPNEEQLADLATKLVTKEAIQVSGWDELVVVGLLICVAAIACWELAKYAVKFGWKQYKAARRPEFPQHDEVRQEPQTPPAQTPVLQSVSPGFTSGEEAYLPQERERVIKDTLSLMTTEALKEVDLLFASLAVEPCVGPLAQGQIVVSIVPAHIDPGIVQEAKPARRNSSSIIRTVKDTFSLAAGSLSASAPVAEKEVMGYLFYCVALRILQV
ncbi:RE1 [Symbiodinium sp. KB8]|nr:RE1 [Symbiodinium sp. KB8]